MVYVSKASWLFCLIFCDLWCVKRVKREKREETDRQMMGREEELLAFALDFLSLEKLKSDNIMTTVTIIVQSIKPPSDKTVVFRSLVFLNILLLFAQDLSSSRYSFPWNLFVCFNGTSNNRISSSLFSLLITRN